MIRQAVRPVTELANQRPRSRRSRPRQTCKRIGAPVAGAAEADEEGGEIEAQMGAQRKAWTRARRARPVRLLVRPETGVILC